MPFKIWSGASSTAKYTSIEDEDKYSKHNKPARTSRAEILFAIFILVIIAVPSYLAGMHHTATRCAKSRTQTILDLHTSPQLFTYNDLYPSHPNLTTDKAWLDLFPMQGGFLKHPELAPEMSTFAVFHQLHCLDGIRHAYWTLLDAAKKGETIEESKAPHHVRPSHVKHCIELLRNAITCQPDLTLEVVNDELGGVTGFGTVHECVDWNQLVSWTSEWEA